LKLPKSEKLNVGKSKLKSKLKSKSKQGKSKQFKFKTQAIIEPLEQIWQLRLYVIDNTAKSALAFENLKKFCEAYLKGRYHIKVIDLLLQPHLAKGDQILAVPTVIRNLPRPVRTIIGNLTNLDHLLVGLDLRKAL
jgi:circadian clock protein KaiB